MKIFISIRHTARSSQNTGIQRVVRGLTRYAVLDSRVQLVEWRNWKGAFFEPMPLISKGMAQFGGPRTENTPRWLPLPKTWKEIKNWILFLGQRRQIPLQKNPIYRREKGWLLLPELMDAAMMREAIDYGRSMDLKVAVILYDCIAYFHPEWVSPKIRENHRGYLQALADSDLVLSISKTSAIEYEHFLNEEKRTGAPVRDVYLAEEYLGIARGKELGFSENRCSKRWKILYVSTLDPRKNHLRLLQAFQRLSEERSDLDWELTLVGHPYEGAEEISQAVVHATQANPRIRWRQGLDDGALASLYEECDFTVFPSLGEGFGLPIAESLWRGRPCLCSEIGSMHEIAEKGGCLEIDPQRVESITTGLIQMMTDSDLQENLTSQLKHREFKTWERYAGEILALLPG
ncbi:MAG: glycosyltransferase family 1 protein [Verrucomicrobiota bacterium]